MHKRRITVIFIIMLLIVQGSFGETLKINPSRILFISSYSPSFETYDNQVDGLKSVLEAEDVLLDIEFMDTKRFYTEDNIKNFYDSLSYKLSHGPRYDVVIVGDDNALNFVKNHRELFEHIPIVFLGINDFEKLRDEDVGPLMTGVYETVSISGTVELAKRLKPNAKRVVGLFDSTVTSNAIIELYKKASKSDELPYDVIDLSNMDFDTYINKIGQLTEDDIVLYVSVHRDMLGETITFKEGLDLTKKYLKQPLFCLYDFGLYNGMVGGDVVSFVEQGKKAGEIALNIIAGQPIEGMTIEEVSHMKMVDYTIAESFNLQMKDMDDVTFVNREISIISRVLPYLIIAIVVVVIQCILIFYLFFNVKRRKRIESELVNKRYELLSSNEELITINEELIASNDELEDSNKRLTDAVGQIEHQQKEIYQLVYQDVLTGLNNRRAISEKIEIELHQLDLNEKYAVLFLDVDNFKLINDTFGHDFGDDVIIETAERLMQLDDFDVTIGRFGGDEFLILFKYELDNQLIALLDRLKQQFKRPILLDDKSMFLTISIGVACYPDHGRHENDLIKKADMALYEAKQSGKNRYVVFNQTMHEALEDKVDFQGHIRQAMTNEEFYLNYQPYYDLKTSKFIGAEALIRWHSKTLGFVSPLKLINAAEEMGLIVELGRWVMKEACKFAKEINDRYEQDISISINISSVQLMHPSFLEDVRMILESTKVDPKQIVLEMTETTLFEYHEANIHIIDRLKKMGLSIALDDFGTGYSSLSYFKNIPANILKIDRAFVIGLSEQAFDRYTIEVIINLAHQKGVKVVAEGVEDLNQVTLLETLDCDIIQGYYFSKPLSGEDTLVFFESSDDTCSVDSIS